MLGIPWLSLNSLLSLPVISYFLLPTTTIGWSTYLNLIFFSLAWTSVVWTQPPLAVEFFSLLGVRLFFYILPSTLFLAFDLSVPSVAKTLKAREGALPAEAAVGGSSTSRTRSSPHERLLRIVGLALFNILLSVALQTAIDFLFTDLLRFRSVLKISSRLPVPWSLMTDVIKGLLLRGTVSYYVHRFLLHSPSYAPRLAKAHAAYAHSLATALPFAAAYDHPAAYLLHRWLPLYLPALAFRYHIFTYVALTALVSLEEALVFSGYQVLPSTVLLTGVARRQERHLMSRGAGNYGPYGLLDVAHGTNVGESDVVADVRAEAGKRDVKGKARGAVHAARDAVGERHRGGDEVEEEEDEEGDEEPNGGGAVGRRGGKKGRK